MPVPPAELSAELTIHGPDGARAAAAAVAAPSGIYHEGGPGVMELAGSRTRVLAALGDVVTAALDAHAHRIDVRFDAPADVR